MISMTEYWEQYQECIDSLPASTQDKEYSKLITTAKDLIKMGLTIEELGLTAIQGITTQITDKTKELGPEVTYKKDSFHLPTISTTESLVFAILYYQHMVNYQNVSYQGSINWFKQRVIDGVEEKKPSMARKAQAMLDAIHLYCLNQNISIDESLLLRNKTESRKEYSERISMMLHKSQAPLIQSLSLVSNEKLPTSPQNSPTLLTKRLAIAFEHPKPSNVVAIPGQFDRITTLEASLKQLNDKWQGLKTKSDELAQKLAAHDQAKQNHLILTNEWQNKSFIIRAFYWFISFFVEVAPLKNIKKAEVQLLQAENELNLLIPQYTADSYGAELKKQQKKLKSEQVDMQGELRLLKELQQKEEARRAAELEALEAESKVASPASPYIQSSPGSDDPLSSQETFDSLSQEEEELSQTNDEVEGEEETADTSYYAFFKSHLPDRKVIGAAALTAAAVVAYNVL